MLTIKEKWEQAKKDYGNKAHEHFYCKHRSIEMLNARIEAGHITENGAIEDWVDRHPCYVFEK